MSVKTGAAGKSFIGPYSINDEDSLQDSGSDQPGASAAVPAADGKGPIANVWPTGTEPADKDGGDLETGPSDCATGTMPAATGLTSGSVAAGGGTGDETLRAASLQQPAAPLAAADSGIAQVDGTAGDDRITLDYVDGDGDSVRDDDVPDLVVAGAGNDKIQLYRGDDTAFGGAGDDSIYGQKGENELHGGAGNDDLYSGAHSSQLFGDDGDDVLVAQLGKGGDHTLTGGAGNDTFEVLAPSLSNTSNVTITDFLADSETLLVAGEVIDFENLPGGVSLGLDENGDVLLTIGDDDTILFKNSDVETFIPYWNLLGQVDGTAGNDRIDRNYADAQDETVSDGADLVYAGAGDDKVQLYGGDDTAHGGDGADSIYGSKGQNELHGGAGDDLIHSGRHSSELFGGDGDDVLIAQLNKGADHALSGGEGADTFRLLYPSAKTDAHVQVTDFVAGTDVLEIDGEIVDFENLPQGMTLTEDDDGNAVLWFSDDESVTFAGVAPDSLLPQPVTEAEFPELGDGPGLPFIAAEPEAGAPEGEDEDLDLL